MKITGVSASSGISLNALNVSNPSMPGIITSSKQFGVKFVLANALPGVKVNVDSDRLMQVFANLFSNAAKFSPPNNEVTISVSRYEKAIRVAITDSGPGIPTK